MKIYPVVPSQNDIPQCIKEVSPTFIDIYLQADEAKQSGLNQICGPGYLKAIEHLIKDYAKSKVDDYEEKLTIENTWIKNVIDNYIEEPRIQKVAERAIWLGNDETHYLRKWEEHDIEDLISLIKLTILWIDLAEQSKKYIEDLQ